MSGQGGEEGAQPPPRPESSSSQRRAAQQENAERPLHHPEHAQDLDSLALSSTLGVNPEALSHQLHRGPGENPSYLQQFPGEIAQHASSHFAAPPGILLHSHALGGGAYHPGLPDGAPRLPGYGDYGMHSSIPRPESSGARQAHEDAGLSDEDLEDDDGTGKRKATMTEEDRKKRRQEINRQSARRIRERRTHEMENLRLQVSQLKEQQGTLLRYAAQLAREKNGLVQRTLELTERWNITAAENLELRSRLQDLGQVLPPPSHDPPQHSAYLPPGGASGLQ